ncbi:hypothetical protein [Herminiimonas contaminans]|uniref:Uncharacterized protein n=1 Tax=Herminiimonas contaminans TaxID=1111140 RepID=A0ABS0ET34_9BURK|nr:hypothetical protein [Herminiimonas contaminans]MBF8177904.1 hypothetical protein [Herminiimonas contaminans]
MTAPPMLDPNALLKPLNGYIVEDLTNADIAATGAIAASILGDLAAPVLKMLSVAGDSADDISLEFFPDPDDESTPGTLIFWPATRTSLKSSYDDAYQAEYSLRLAVFLSERDDSDVIYPAGFSMVLKLNESACELVKNLPPAVFERLEFQMKGGPLPGGFEFLDDSEHIPVLPNMRRQFLKAITRAHSVTAKKRSKEFEAVMVHYIWDNTEPQAHFEAVLSTLATLFVAVHHQSKL